MKEITFLHFATNPTIEGATSNSWHLVKSVPISFEIPPSAIKFSGGKHIDVLGALRILTETVGRGGIMHGW